MMLIETGTLNKNMLVGQTAVVTGAGGGIGYEAARALLWLGASVVIAEINPQTGKTAAAQLSGEFSRDKVLFIQADVASERSIDHLVRQVKRQFGNADILINNATVTPLGAVKDVPIKKWDWSYQVNLRGPVLLTQAFLPDMLARNYGVLVSISSYGPAYMGAYEIFKKAQTELASTLDAELQGTGVIAFTIGPGYVPTATAREGIEAVAHMYGKDSAVFYDMVKPQTLTAEAAGAGFAAAVALAGQFRGQEISSIVALNAAGIDIENDAGSSPVQTYTAEELEAILVNTQTVYQTLEEHVRTWQDFNLFQRQWLTRTFQKDAGMNTEQWLQALKRLEEKAAAQDSASVAALNLPVAGLVKYYQGLYDRAQGFVKDPVEREKQLGIVKNWQNEAERLSATLKNEVLFTGR
jgi:NAD(P)-dependent dehydrogenase (short-subunit alcohol dehydrogenase family)